MRRRSRIATVAMIAILLLIVQAGSAFAKPKPTPQPATPPVGVTEEQAEQSYHAYFEALLRDKGPQIDNSVSPMYIPIENGDMQIITRENTWVSGKIADEGYSNLYDSIKWIMMKVLSMAYKTVASIISAVEAAWNLFHDPQIGVTAKTYHEYVHRMRVAQYYQNGSWYNGAGVEQRNVWGSGWTSYVSTTGVPVQAWDSTTGTWMTSYEGCNYYNDDWLTYTAQGTYLGEWSYTVESYNSCLPYVYY